MKTLQQFLEEGKEKERKKKLAKLAKKITKQVETDEQKQRIENPNKPVISNYPDTEPHSIERQAAIKAMTDRDREWRKMMKKNLPKDQKTM